VAWSEGWLWLSVSLLMADLWANLSWLFRENRSGWASDLAAHLSNWRFSPWLLQFLRLLYYIGVPFAALLWGHDVVVGRLLGLQPLALPIPGKEETGVNVAANLLDWAHDLGWTTSLALGTWVLLALTWCAYRRALSTAETGDAVAGLHSSGWVLLREAIYHEVHWAFYRNAPILTMNMYGGTWIGLALAALEATLNPSWHKGLTDPGQAPAQLLQGALAVVSGVQFLLTQNLWLALPLHWAVSWAVVAFARALPIAKTGTPCKTC
jgi:hypothetical protein